jgi:ABC-type lipoprotein release transport system permease subunit
MVSKEIKMEENKQQDELARAYARLSSLRKNIGDIKYGIEEKYVFEYHGILDKFQYLGVDTSEFRIPDSEIAPIVTSISTLTFEDRPSGVTYSKEKYVDRSFFLIKLDAILGYFEITTSKEPRKIGYRTPDKQ